MKAASTLIQIMALSACLTAQGLSGGEFKMAGVRRAIQTIANAGPATQLPLTAETMAVDDAASLAG